EVVEVVGGALAVVVVVGVPGPDVLLGHGDVPLGQDPAVLGVAGHLRAGGGLEHGLGAAVAVEVVDQELGVVGTGADVDAQVDPPQQGAVELVGVEVGVAGVAALGDVLGVGRVPLDDVLVLPVAVDVADAEVVGGVRVRLAGRGDPVRGLFQRDV